MIIDCNLIAYEYQKDQFSPNSVEKSGEKDGENAIYKTKSENNAVLILKDDIINPDGLGLKKGFYNVKPDVYLDNLLIYQKGDLKAKIPVVKVEVIETNNPKQEKVKKMSQKAYQKYLEKEQKKYYRGINPNELDYKTAKIEYVSSQNAWLLIYHSNIIKLLGIIKF